MLQVVATGISNRRPSVLAFRPETPRLIHRPSLQLTDQDVNTLGHYINFSSNNNSTKNFADQSLIDGAGSLDDGYFSELFSTPDFNSTCTSSSPSSTEEGLFCEETASSPIFFIGSPESTFGEIETPLDSNCSLYDDLENTLNATVERNLEIHLSASHEFQLPEIPLSEDDNFLQFELELPHNTESHQTHESSPQTQTSHALINPTSSVLQESQSCPGLFVPIPSVSSPSLSPLHENPGSMSDDGFGISLDSPLFFIPESNAEGFNCTMGVKQEESSEASFSEQASEADQDSARSMDGYSVDHSASPSTSNSESLSGSPLNRSVCVSPIRFIRICPPLTTPGLPTVVSSEEDSSSRSSKSMPRYLQIVRDPTKKKNQNREASQRYRNKKRTEVASLEQTVAELRLRKKELMDRIEGKRKEAGLLKGLLFEMDL